MTVSGNAQNRKNLESQKRQNQKQIQVTTKLLNETKEGRKKSYNNLLLLNKQIETRQGLINEISSGINDVEGRIKENEDSLENMEIELSDLKSAYKKMVQHAYKTKNSQDRLLFVFSSKDFNQAYKRLAYMKELARYRRQQAEEIILTQDLIKSQNLKLDSIRNEKLDLLGEKESETKKLHGEVREQNGIITHLKTQESTLKAELQKHQNMASKLQKEIEKLIAEEAKKNSSGSYSMTPEEKIVSTNFGNNKGKLPWPVATGVITGHYGKHAHAVLRNVFVNNNGVDISTNKGSVARSLFDGEVRKIFKVPGYQNAVIIRHGNYLSTYTHLEMLYVSVGDKVSTKQSIGIVHTDTQENKTVIHVEIWYGQTKLDPEQWLAK
jgi:septal ring factor EnvC (AmiA/AmiB activator)